MVVPVVSGGSNEPGIFEKRVYKLKAMGWRAKKKSGGPKISYRNR